MSAETNKELIRTMDPAEMMDYLADDVRWTVHGTARFCGTFRGKDDLTKRLLQPILERMASLGTFTTQRLIAEDDYVVVQAFASDRMTKTGQPYNNTYCLVYRIADDKITEIDEYCDTELINTAFGD